MKKKNVWWLFDSEFHGDEEKFLNKISGIETPNFIPRDNFKEKLDKKIYEKIDFASEQMAEQETIDSIPSKLKWRFYLTWFWYSVCGFLVLFLIWFCTNIFTWTLKVPTKYTYIDTDQAFWNLNNIWEFDEVLVDNVDEENSLWYVKESKSESEEKSISLDDNNSSTRGIIENKIINKNKVNDTIISTNELVDSNLLSTYSLFNNNFMFNETYRFTYKDKLFPKLASKYPVYRSSWILIWSNTPNQFLKNLKIWDISFKNFQDLELTSFTIDQKIKDWYSIIFDSYNKKLHFYPNNTWIAQNYDKKLSSKKQILRDVEKNLKSLWISIKNYWDGEVDVDNYDKNMWTVKVFYPLKIQWKEVWDPKTEDRVWIDITYDLNLQKIVSVIWVDIATYDVSDYPLLDMLFIKNWVEKWWSFYNQWALHEGSVVVLLDRMDIVYIVKNSGSETYFIPAIKWDITTYSKNYAWPKYIFQEIVD